MCDELFNDNCKGHCKHDETSAADALLFGLPVLLLLLCPSFETLALLVVVGVLYVAAGVVNECMKPKKKVTAEKPLKPSINYRFPRI